MPHFPSLVGGMSQSQVNKQMRQFHGLLFTQQPFLRSGHMPGIVLGAKDTAVNKTKFLLLWSLYISWEAGETYNTQ